MALQLISNPSKCTTKNSKKPSLEKKSVSTLRFQLQISNVVMFAVKQHVIHQLNASNSQHKMIISNHLGKIHAGYQPFFDCHTAHVACKFAKLIQRINHRQEWIQKDDADVVVVETFKEYPALGRFVVSDMKQTVAVGVIHVVEKKKVEDKKKK